MTLIVEDGTGRSDAQSLCSVAAADSYWTARGGTVWVGTATADKEVALVKASDYIRNQSRYRWVGGKKSYVQTMPWPRTSASERDGLAVPDTIVPWQVIEATAFLANKALTVELQPDLARGGAVKSESVGPISTTYMDKAKLETTIQFVDGIIAMLLRWPGREEVVPADYAPDIPAGFETDQFTNP